MPDNFDDAYQVYINGQFIGEFGKFGKHRVTAYSGLPTGFLLPREVSNGLMTIAVRMWMDSATPFNSPDAGGMRQRCELAAGTSVGTRARAFDSQRAGRSPWPLGAPILD